MAKFLDRLSSDPPVLPTVLVTSGLSFLGASLCQALLNRHCFVYCLDTQNGVKKERLGQLNKDRNFQFLPADPKSPLKNISNLDFDYIFQLSSGERLSWGTAGLLKLAHKQKAKLLLLSSFFSQPSRKLNEALAAKYFSDLDLNIRTVRLAETYGPGMEFDDQTEVGSYFNNLKKRKIFEISGDGSQPFTPLFINDAVNGLLKAMFGQETKGKIFWLSGNTGITTLEFCQELKKLSGRTLGLEFTTSKKKISQPPLKALLESQKQLNWQPQMSLKKGLKLTLIWFRKEQLFPKTKKIKAKKNKFLIIFLILFFFFCLVLGILLPLFYYYTRSVREVNKLREALVSYDFSSLDNQSFESRQMLDKGKNYLLTLSPGIKFLHLEKVSNEFNNFFDFGISLVKLANLTKLTANQTTLLLEMIIKGNDGDFYYQTEQLTFYLREFWEELNVLQLEIQQETPDQNQEQLATAKKQVTLLADFVKILPQLIAFETKKTYFVLLQNNLELRPTGGFISSWGLLSFEKGRLLDLQLYSSSRTDQQLKGQIEPPQILKKYLGVNSWRLCDSNWDPHFPVSANRAEWFLDNELGRTADGTLAFNLFFLKDILSVIQPLKLEGNSESITQTNFLEKIVQQEEIALGNKELAQQVTESIFIKLKDLTPGDWLKLLSLIVESLDKKDLQVLLHEQRAYDFFNQRGWDGGLRQLSEKDTYLADYLLINEANLGLNKINYFIKKEMKQEITILADGKIQEKVTLNYLNTNDLINSPLGLYKNYLRFYLPLNTKILSVKTGEKENALYSVDASQINPFVEYGKQGTGFMVEIPALQNKIVEIIYQLGSGFNLSNQTLGYAYFFQKQPGTGEDPLEIIVNYPEGWKLIKNVPKLEIKGNQASFKTTTLKDRLLLITFGH